MTKIFHIEDGACVCKIEYNGSFGELSYDFNDGRLIGNCPKSMPNCDWLICCRKFVAICLKLNAPFLET